MSDRPEAVVRHRLRDTVSMSWADGRSGEFVVRGGIAWPVRAEDGRIEGALLIGAWSIRKHTLSVLDELLFSEIDHAVGPDGRIEREGACNWIASALLQCSCLAWYHTDKPDVANPWAEKVLRSKMIKPKPRLLFMPCVNPEQMIMAWADAGRVFYAENGPLDRAMARTAGRPPGVEGSLSPIERALASVLSSFERVPWTRAARPYGDGTAAKDLDARKAPWE